MLSRLIDKEEFRCENYFSWQNNSEFWIKNHQVDQNIQNYLSQILYELCSSDRSKKTICDVGCGDAWLLQTLLTKKLKFSKYIGIDYNVKFIDHLNIKFAKYNQTTFYCTDIEKRLPYELINKSDILINCLNLIELPDLKKAFNNIFKLAKRKASIFIISLNPLMELIRDSKDSVEILHNNLTFYESSAWKTIIYKKIVCNGLTSERNYFRILYSLQDYIRASIESGFKIMDASKISGKRLFTGVEPPIFDFIHLIKP